jgi:hypothetical protein
MLSKYVNYTLLIFNVLLLVDGKYFYFCIIFFIFNLSQMSDQTTDVGKETDGTQMSSAASSVSYDLASERTNMSETEDSNSCPGPSSSETDSYSLGKFCTVYFLIQPLW